MEIQAIHHLHTGTHVDAPFHFDANGKTIDQIPIEDFHYTKPLVLEIAKGKGERIRYEDLKSHESEIKECDILFLYTGHSRLRDISPEDFVDNFPCMEVMAAKYLRKEFPRLKAIAMDSISYDSAITGEDEGFPCHHALLETNSEQKERTLLLFEDVNIQKLLGVERIKEICAFPIRFSQLEAAPVAMVAITDHI